MIHTAQSQQRNRSDKSVRLLQYLQKAHQKKTDDNQLLQLRLFQQEVQQKYLQSTHNHIYRFPYDRNKESNDSSLDELQHATVYDLNQQYSPRKRNDSSKSTLDNTSKLLLKIMSDKQFQNRSIHQEKQVQAQRQSQRYKTECQEQPKSTFQAALDNFLRSKQQQCKSLEKQHEPQYLTKLQQSSRCKQTRVISTTNKSDILIHNDTSQTSCNRPTQNVSYIQLKGTYQERDPLSRSFNQQNRTPKVQNYYLNRNNTYKLNQSPENILLNYNSLGQQQLDKSQKISLKQFFSNKNGTNRNGPQLEQQHSISFSSNLKHKLQQICQRQPLKIIK